MLQQRHTLGAAVSHVNSQVDLVDPDGLLDS